MNIFCCLGQLYTKNAPKLFWNKAYVAQMNSVDNRCRLNCLILPNIWLGIPVMRRKQSTNPTKASFDTSQIVCDWTELLVQYFYIGASLHVCGVTQEFYQHATMS
jgi:hypothetical protein